MSSPIIDDINVDFRDKDDLKKSADGLVIPLVKGNDWRIERLLRLKSEGKLSEEECAKLELLTAAVSPSLINVAEVTHSFVTSNQEILVV